MVARARRRLSSSTLLALIVVAGLPAMAQAQELDETRLLVEATVAARVSGKIDGPEMIQRLGFVGEPSLPHLSRMIKEPRWIGVRDELLDAVVQISPELAEMFLLVAMADTNDSILLETILPALGPFARDASLPQVFELLAHSSPQVRQRAADCFADALRNVEEPEAEPWVVRLRSLVKGKPAPSDPIGQREAALLALVGFQRWSAVPELLACLETSLRRDALSCMARLEVVGGEVEEEIDESWEQRYELQEALTGLLLDLTTDDMDRKLAFQALREWGDHGCIPGLIALLEDGDPNLVKAAQAALESITGVSRGSPEGWTIYWELIQPTWEHYEELLASLQPPRRESEAMLALRKLPSIRGPRTVAAIGRVLTGYHSVTEGMAACEALAAMGDRRAIPALRLAFDASKHDAVKLKAAWALGVLGEIAVWRAARARALRHSSAVSTSRGSGLKRASVRVARAPAPPKPLSAADKASRARWMILGGGFLIMSLVLLLVFLVTNEEAKRKARKLEEAIARLKVAAEEEALRQSMPETSRWNRRLRSASGRLSMPDTARYPRPSPEADPISLGSSKADSGSGRLISKRWRLKSEEADRLGRLREDVELRREDEALSHEASDAEVLEGFGDALAALAEQDAVQGIRRKDLAELLALRAEAEELEPTDELDWAGWNARLLTLEARPGGAASEEWAELCFLLMQAGHVRRLGKTFESGRWGELVELIAETVMSEPAPPPSIHQIQSLLDLRAELHELSPESSTTSFYERLTRLEDSLAYNSADTLKAILGLRSMARAQLEGDPPSAEQVREWEILVMQLSLQLTGEQTAVVGASGTLSLDTEVPQEPRTVTAQEPRSSAAFEPAPEILAKEITEESTVSGPLQEEEPAQEPKTLPASAVLSPREALQEIMRLGARLHEPISPLAYENLKARVEELEGSLKGGGFTELAKESCFSLLQVAYCLRQGKELSPKQLTRWRKLLVTVSAEQDIDVDARALAPASGRFERASEELEGPTLQVDAAFGDALESETLRPFLPEEEQTLSVESLFPEVRPTESYKPAVDIDAFFGPTDGTVSLEALFEESGSDDANTDPPEVESTLDLDAAFSDVSNDAADVTAPSES